MQCTLDAADESLNSTPETKQQQKINLKNPPHTKNQQKDGINFI